MRRLLQVCSIGCGVYALLLQLPFVNSLENTPIDVVRAGFREMERANQLTNEQSVALNLALISGYKKAWAERYEAYLRERNVGRLLLFLAIVSFVGGRHIPKKPKPPLPIPGKSPSAKPSPMSSIADG